MVVAARLRRLAGADETGDMGGRQHQRHVVHRKIDALAALRALALEQCARQREGGHRAGGVIDRGRAELDWIDLFRSRHRHQTGRGLDHEIISGLAAARTAVAERRDRTVDQARRNRAQRLVAEPQRIEGAGPVVLDQHVRGCDQALEDLTARFGLQVERDRTLVRTLREIIGAHAIAAELAIAAAAAALVGIAGILNLDDVGAEQSELIGSEGTSQNVGRVDDPYPFERARHVPPPSGRLV